MLCTEAFQCQHYIIANIRQLQLSFSLHTDCAASLIDSYKIRRPVSASKQLYYNCSSKFELSANQCFAISELFQHFRTSLETNRSSTLLQDSHFTFDPWGLANELMLPMDIKSVS